MTGRDWVEAYASALGVPAPDQATVDAVLELASVAAHGSERWAAPVTCWIAAAAGLEPSAALDVAARIADTGER